MRFMIVEKTRISFPAIVSGVFTSEKEAGEYGYKKPAKGLAKVIKVKNGFELIDKTVRMNAPLNRGTETKKKINCGKVTLFLKDVYKCCRVVVF